MTTPAQQALINTIAGLLPTNNQGLDTAAQLRSALSAVITSQRTLLTSAANFYVAPTGSDANDGTTPATAFLTPQGALATVFGLYDFGNQLVTINHASGTPSVPFVYPGFSTESVALASANWVGGGSLTLLGNPASPASCVLNGTGSNSAALLAIGAGPIVLNGFHVQSAANSGIVVGEHTVVTIANIEFGTCAYAHIVCGSGADLILGGNYSVVGNAPTIHMSCSQGSSLIRTIGAVTVTITGSPSVTFWAFAAENSTIEVPGMTFVGAPASGCVKWEATLNAVINTGSNGNVNYFPGSINGVPASGGQYT